MNPSTERRMTTLYTYWLPSALDREALGRALNAPRYAAQGADLDRSWTMYLTRQRSIMAFNQAMLHDEKTQRDYTYWNRDQAVVRRDEADTYALDLGRNTDGYGDAYLAVITTDIRYNVTYLSGLPFVHQLIGGRDGEMQEHSNTSMVHLYDQADTHYRGLYGEVFWQAALERRLEGDLRQALNARARRPAQKRMVVQLGPVEEALHAASFVRWINFWTTAGAAFSVV